MDHMTRSSKGTPKPGPSIGTPKPGPSIVDHIPGSSIGTPKPGSSKGTPKTGSRVRAHTVKPGGIHAYYNFGIVNTAIILD